MNDAPHTQFQQQALHLAAAQQAPDWLSALRFAGAEQWLQAGWPGRRTELWKYTPLQALQKTPFQNASGALHSIPANTLLDVDATRLVFVNGILDAGASSLGQTGVVLFSAASPEQQALIARHLGTVATTPRHLFATLSNALAGEGVLVHVPRGAMWEKPVYVVNIAVPEAGAALVSPRLLVVVEDSAQVELIEHFASDAQAQNGFVNSLTEIHCGANARVQHYRINLEEEHLLHIGGVHVDLWRDARYQGFTLAEGSTLKRLDYQITHQGAGASAVLNGVYLPRHQQLLDYHTNVEHKAPHCTTAEVFRGIVADDAKAVFNGRIHIHPHAQKTLAELNNRTLLTSDRAEIDTKPELEIYADDVKCAHGATVSQIDADALFYLRSRGLTHEQARSMLSFGFINELLQGITQVAVRDYLHKHLQMVFAEADSIAPMPVADAT
jgi:Fe-S cluster assembly protein SufD